MGRYIIKITDNDEDYYLEWSTVVDTPVTYGMKLEEFQDYYKETYGSRGMAELPARLERVQRTNSSAHLESRDDLLRSNRAGEGETKISLEEIIEIYIRGRS